MANKAEMFTETWRRERHARLLKQLAVNAEIKRRSLAADHSEAQSGRAANGAATLSRPAPQHSAPFRAWLAAAERPVNHALAYLVSVLGLQRLTGKQANSSHG